MLDWYCRLKRKRRSVYFIYSSSCVRTYYMLHINSCCMQSCIHTLLISVCVIYTLISSHLRSLLLARSGGPKTRCIRCISTPGIRVPELMGSTQQVQWAQSDRPVDASTAAAGPRASSCAPPRASPTAAAGGAATLSCGWGAWQWCRHNARGTELAAIGSCAI